MDEGRDALGSLVSQGWCIFLPHVHVSQWNNNPHCPPPLHHATLSYTCRSNKQQGGRPVETDLWSCVRKAKIYHSRHIFEDVTGINVGDYFYLGVGWGGVIQDDRMREQLLEY